MALGAHRKPGAYLAQIGTGLCPLLAVTALGAPASYLNGYVLPERQVCTIQYICAQSRTLLLGGGPHPRWAPCMAPQSTRQSCPKSQ